MMRRFICFVLAAVMCLGQISYAQASETETAQELNPADNPSLLLQSLSLLYDSGKISSDNEAVLVEAADDDGIVISGAGGQLGETRFLIDEDYDFGSSKLQRIMVCGLGEKGTVTKVGIYLDGSGEPCAVITLPASDGDDILDEAARNANAIVAEQNISGGHRVEFSVCQYAADGAKAASDDARVLLTGIQFVAESIPLINIRIDESQGTVAAMNDDSAHEAECHGEMDILVGEGYICDYSEDYSGGTYTLDYIKGRGNSSWKKEVRRPYKIKLTEAADLFGMGEEKSWALLANYYDDTLMHNAFTYKLGELLGSPFTPQYIPVDVVLNGEYLGSYMLIEKTGIGESRVAIDNLDENEGDSNITGGYLLSLGAGGADADVYSFKTQQGYHFNVASPCDAENPAYEAEIAYIEEYVQRIENALYGEPDPVTGMVEDPFSLMDLESAVRYYLIQELSANCDFLVTDSNYCYKLRDGKLYWGPLWDFDVAWEGTSLYEDIWIQQSGWFQRMFFFDEFVDAVKSYCIDTLTPAMAELLSEDGYAKTYYDAIRYSAVNNFTLWGIGPETPRILKSWAEKPDTDSFEYGTDEVISLCEEKCSTFFDNAGYRAQWCADNLDSLRGEAVKVQFFVGDELVDTVDGITGFAVYPFAEAPAVEEGSFFGGWYYMGTDYEGNAAQCSLSGYESIDPYSIETVDGENCFRIYADIRDESLNITSLSLPQASYNLTYDPSTFNFFSIPVCTQPFDGYDDLVEWSVDDSAVIGFLMYSDKQLSFMIMGEGTAVISAALRDGTGCSITVNVKEISEDFDSSEYAVTDFGFSEEQLTLAVGEHALVGIEVLAPEEYMNVTDFMGCEYIWSVESGDSCSVREDGIITAEQPGETVLVCTHIISGVSRSITVEVE